MNAETPHGRNYPTLENIFTEANANLPAQLATDMAPEIERTKALVENAAHVPAVIKSDEEEAKATDIVSQMKKHHKLIEGRRNGINVGPRTAKDIIDTFCKSRCMDPLEKEWTRIEPGVTAYKRIKVEKARREAEERAELARQEEQRQREAQARAEADRRKAEEAKRKAEQEQRDAEEAKRKAVEEARLAEERKVAAQMEAIEAEKRAEEAKTKRAKAAAEREARDATERAAAAEADRQRQRLEAERQRNFQAAAKTDAALARAELSDANKVAKTATSLAKSAEGDVRKADKAAEAPAAKLSGARGDLGGQSGLRTVWVGDIIDRNLLDKKELWPFIKEEHLQAALDKYVSVHKGDRQLKGARIYQTDGTAFR